MVARQECGDLEEVSIVARGKAKIGVDKIAECLDVIIGTTRGGLRLFQGPGSW